MLIQIRRIIPVLSLHLLERSISKFDFTHCIYLLLVLSFLIYSDTATNISKDFASGLMSSLELPKKIFPKHEVAVGDSLALDYNDQINEYDLLENAMARISSRNNKQVCCCNVLSYPFLSLFVNYACWNRRWSS